VEEARGLASLRNTLWELQRLLGEGWLQADRTSLQLATSPEVWVDVHHFQRLLREAQATGRTPTGESVDALAQAVALYRGRLLEGLALPDCAAFSEWQSQATEQHHLQATQALERLTSALILQGRLEEALPHAQRLVALEPTHEEAHRQLIRLYAWLERWTDALRQHRHCVDMLRTGLDAPPQVETQRLLEQLQARSVPPPPRGSSPPAPEPAPPLPHSHALPAPSTVLCGRTAEL
jgi:DNA-binding SARP family transcriptional activator